MDKQDVIFGAAFIVTLSVLVYLLGISITGYYTKTMYCEDGVCKSFCTADITCDLGEVCCNIEGFGVCEVKSDCELQYKFNPGLDVEPSELPAPSPARYGIALYALLIFVALLVAYKFLAKRRQRKRILRI